MLLDFHAKICLEKKTRRTIRTTFFKENTMLRNIELINEHNDDECMKKSQHMIDFSESEINERRRM
jgi:hypothetical protein